MSKQPVSDTSGREASASGQDDVTASSRVIRLEQELAAEREARRRQAAIAAVASHIREIRDLRGRGEAGREMPAAREEERPAGGVVFDSAEDTEWSAREPALERVAHVFHDEWHGIRAAAAYLPGAKVAIPTRRALMPAEHRSIIDRLAARRARAVALHGFSDSIVELATVLRRALAGEVRICAVYHGSSAQFHTDLERRAFFDLVELKRRRILDALGSVKPDLHLVSDAVHPVLLLNLPPTVTPPRRRAAPSGAVFVPVPLEWRKNFYTNVFAAQAAPRVRRIYFTAKPPADAAWPAKGAIVPRPQRRQLLHLLSRVDLVLNATLSECQPMTALEALAAGIPAVTGPLSLGSLDEHPYQRLAQVRAPDTVGPVRDAIERFLELGQRSPLELAGMLDDYRARLHQEAIARAVQFYTPGM